MIPSAFSMLAGLSVKSWTPSVQTVRFRYWKDQQGAGHIVKRYGYKDDFLPKGLLARPKDAKERIKEMRIYRPKDVWCEKRAMFGQNDYIDILGDNNIHPTKILYHLPQWLRGAGGNEYQLLLRKRKVLEKTDYSRTHPKHWKEMNYRIDFLYKYFNTRQRYGMPTE